VGSLIIAWTIRASVLLFFATLFAWVLQSRPSRWDRGLRIIWSLGFLLFVAHVVAAFHFHHHWSHRAALAETARQTRDLIGLEFGAGLYFNYLFMLIWAVDLICIWCAKPEFIQRNRWLRLTWIAYLIFIAFNGVAVFKGGWMRAGGIAALTLIGLGAVLRLKSNHPAIKRSPDSIEPSA
jgi:hypothetical protein